MNHANSCGFFKTLFERSPNHITEAIVLLTPTRLVVRGNHRSNFVEFTLDIPPGSIQDLPKGGAIHKIDFGGVRNIASAVHPNDHMKMFYYRKKLLTFVFISYDGLSRIFHLPLNPLYTYNDPSTQHYQLQIETRKLAQVCDFFLQLNCEDCTIEPHSRGTRIYVEELEEEEVVTRSVLFIHPPYIGLDVRGVTVHLESLRGTCETMSSVADQVTLYFCSQHCLGMEFFVGPRQRVYYEIRE